MPNDQPTYGQGDARRGEKQGGLSRRAFMLRLLAAGAVYAAPALVTVNEARAWSRHTGRSPYSRRSRNTRHSRWSRGSGLWHHPVQVHDGPPASGGFQPGDRAGEPNGGVHPGVGGWAPK